MRLIGGGGSAFGLRVRDALVGRRRTRSLAPGRRPPVSRAANKWSGREIGRGTGPTYWLTGGVRPKFVRCLFAPVRAPVRRKKEFGLWPGRPITCNEFMNVGRPLSRARAIAAMAAVSAGGSGQEPHCLWLTTFPNCCRQFGARSAAVSNYWSQMIGRVEWPPES